MPADSLSRNAISSISYNDVNLATKQQEDPKLRALRDFLLQGLIPATNTDEYRFVKMFQGASFVENDVLWRRLRLVGQPDRVVMYAPPSMRQEILAEAHGFALSGHGGQLKTKERVMQTFYWPGMDFYVQQHIKTCHKCQVRHTDDRPPPVLLTPLPEVHEPNLRVHANLFGPLVTTDWGKKYVLCITDAFSKYVKLTALDNKRSGHCS